MAKLTYAQQVAAFAAALADYERASAQRHAEALAQGRITEEVVKQLLGELTALRLELGAKLDKLIGAAPPAVIRDGAASSAGAAAAVGSGAAVTARGSPPSKGLEI